MVGEECLTEWYLTMSQLTTKQARFVEEYCVDGNGTRAAIRAGYSPRTARQIAYENLTKPYICDEIEQQQAMKSVEAQLTKEWVIQRLLAVATDMRIGGSTRVRAIVQIARIMGYLTHRHRSATGPVYHRHVDGSITV